MIELPPRCQWRPRALVAAGRGAWGGLAGHALGAGALGAVGASPADGWVEPALLAAAAAGAAAVGGGPVGERGLVALLAGGLGLAFLTAAGLAGFGASVAWGLAGAALAVARLLGEGAVALAARLRKLWGLPVPARAPGAVVRPLLVGLAGGGWASGVHALAMGAGEDVATALGVAILGAHGAVLGVEASGRWALVVVGGAEAGAVLELPAAGEGVLVGSHATGVDLALPATEGVPALAAVVWAHAHGVRVQEPGGRGRVLAHGQHLRGGRCRVLAVDRGRWA